MRARPAREAAARVSRDIAGRRQAEAAIAAARRQVVADPPTLPRAAASSAQTRTYVQVVRWRTLNNGLHPDARVRFVGSTDRKWRTA